ncbi:methionine ABC transporter ATP-binding protein [Marinobacter salinus]|uniref:Methionine ABC transporter ATP-binding protein n=1 Tax=Marinobacter salinus TaxID=1874317 RepID=A0A1D9GRV7_9GAMM|nr:ABC transporter ATP-binding protein [Marinobacter salinus]AOY90359.1 methionine ABC transporter ATP-binding protein [Marinobacter salinus]
MTSKTDSYSVSSPGPETAIEVHGLGFSWRPEQEALNFPDFSLNRGEHLFLHGPSGSGKSTLLSLLAGMLRPGAGSVRILGTDLYQLRAGARDQFRADHIGVIFQQFNLVPYLTTLANVTLPCRLSTHRRESTELTPADEAKGLLRALAIPEDHWQRKVTKLSIGQQQRIAAARALIGAPGLILADEPTSALDTDNRDRFLELLLSLAHRHTTSVLFVSHDRSLAHHFHHQLDLRGTHK